MEITSNLKRLKILKQESQSEQNHISFNCLKEVLYEESEKKNYQDQ